MPSKPKAGAVEKAPPPPKKKAKQQPIKSWALSRNEAGRWVRCYWHDRGERLQMFPIDPPPTVSLIGERWGSGEYKVTAIKGGGGLAGSSTVTVDDPKRPARPAYPNKPGAAPPAAAQRPDLSKLMAASKDDPFAWLSVYRSLDRDARADANREADQRVARMLQDTALTIERERLHATQEIERTKLLYTTLLQAARPTPERDEDEDEDEDEEDELAERLAAVEQKLLPAGDEAVSGADFALRQVGSLIASLKDRPEVMGVILEKIGLGPK